MMTPEDLRAAIAEIYGPTGQRTMARHLSAAGIIRDADGSRLRKMCAGTRPILIEVTNEVARKLAEVRSARSAQTEIERMIADVRRSSPKASLIYAQILLRLARGPAYLADIGMELDDNRDSSTVNQAVRRLEEIGLVTVDRGQSRSAGYTVTLAKRV